nr:hypothetical protein [Hormoscilla sp. GM7CHS1pb]
MNHDQIKKRIEQNMSDAHLDVAELRVQPDPFGGWRIAVVSADFTRKSHFERKQIALAGLSDLHLEWLDLLTPSEREWAGSLPIDSTLEEIPLWPQALARSSNLPEDIVFPSDLEEKLERPLVATFYSLRGGVGCSTALAYTAQILASRGHAVLCVDMDLETPGLPALFGKEAEIKSDFAGRVQGVLSLLLALDNRVRPDVTSHILRISSNHELYCLPAGLLTPNYARQLHFIDMSAWYREEINPLQDLLDILGHELDFKPDVILLDARTGITPLSGPLLFDLADLVIIGFSPNPQTKIGTEALVKALLASKTRRKLTPEPRFLLSPIPASKAPEVVKQYEDRAQRWIDDWLSLLSDKLKSGKGFMASDITHFLPYREAIAISEVIKCDRSIWKDFEPVAEWIERLLPMGTAD